MTTNPLSPQLCEQLSEDTQRFILAQLNGKVPHDTIIHAFFDAQGLPCPMPLLKAKLCLRDIADGENLYLIASDKNSQTDLVAFCQKNEHKVTFWHDNQPSQTVENFFHFIITKKASVSHA